jgi:MATE family multidrug resistance protein
MLGLALPVILGELGWMGMGIVDVWMVGQLGPEVIGAVGIGRAVYITVAIVGLGMLLGLDTLVSQSHGAGRLEDCHRWLVQGLYLGLLLSVPLTATLLLCLPLLSLWGFDPDVLTMITPYLRVISWSILPLLIYTASRRYLQALNLVRPVMFALLSANLINAFCNWVLIFGNLGAPRLGVKGAGFATLFSYLYMATLLLIIALRQGRGAEPAVFTSRTRFDLSSLKRLVHLGFPVSVQLSLEISVFALATMLAGRLDAYQLAAHQIVLIVASTSYMLPLGVSSAAAVRVGQAFGRQSPGEAARAGWTALLLGSVAMLAAALCFVLMPRQLLELFTTDARVIATGISLFAMAALFQLFDGTQVVATGALRGAGDTRSAVYWNLCGHWLFGLPLGYYLCFTLDMGVLGLWIGLSAGLVLIGSGLVYVWARLAASGRNVAIS